MEAFAERHERGHEAELARIVDKLVMPPPRALHSSTNLTAAAKRPRPDRDDASGLGIKRVSAALALESKRVRLREPRALRPVAHSPPGAAEMRFA